MKIIASYQGSKPEVLDTCNSMAEATILLAEYRLAFSKDWLIYLEVNDDF